MALSEETLRKLLELEAKTKRPGSNHEYPEIIRKFLERSTCKTLELTAEGYPFKVYVYTGKNAQPNAPMYINIHGGGWVIGHLDNDDYYSAYLADKINGVVFDIDYTTSNVAGWHVMFAQCIAASEYAIAHAEELGCDPTRISIGGYSAGGHLTAGVVLDFAMRGEMPFALQALCYAPLDMSNGPEIDIDTPIDGPETALKLRGLVFNELLLRGEYELRSNPLVSPVLASDELLAKCPDTLIISAGHCGFRFEDEAYGARIAAQGVLTVTRRFVDANHGFLPHFYDYWEEGTDLLARCIRAAGV